ncbi:MAG TPA: oligosaccharide flippase family protein [Candidatus Paceibacterota bacterium]
MQRLLRWSEEIFKTDMRYVARGGFWLSVGQAFALVSSLGLSVAFANLLPKEVYGNYKFILSMAGLLGGLALTGMGSVVIQAVARGYEGTTTVVAKHYLRWGSGVSATALAIALYYYTSGNAPLAIGILIAGITIPLSGAWSLYGGILSGRKDFKHSTLFWIYGQAVSVVALIITAKYSHNFLALVAVYYLTNILTSYVTYRYIIHKFKPNQFVDTSMVSYGKHLSLMNLFGTLANQLDKILVFHFLGAAPLAVYTFAFAIPEQIKGSYKNLFNIALPRYVELPPDKLRASIIDKTIRLTLVSMLIVTAYILISPYLFQILFPKYLDSVFYSQIYILGLIAIPGISLFGTYFQIKKATATLYKLNIISNIATIVLTVILISRWGIFGAVIENGLSWLVMLVINGYYFVRDTGIRGRGLGGRGQGIDQQVVG